MKKLIPWSDETKIELFMLWEFFSVAGTGRLVRFEGKLNGAKYRDVLNKNLLRTSDWVKGSPSNMTTITDKTTQEWLRATASGPVRAQITTLLNISGETNGWWSPNLTELHRICKEKWQKIPMDVQSLSPHTHNTVNAAEGVSTKYCVMRLNTYLHVIIQFS